MWPGRAGLGAAGAIAEVHCVRPTLVFAPASTRQPSPKEEKNLSMYSPDMKKWAGHGDAWERTVRLSRGGSRSHKQRVEDGRESARRELSRAARGRTCRHRDAQPGCSRRTTRHQPCPVPGAEEKHRWPFPFPARQWFLGSDGNSQGLKPWRHFCENYTIL